MELPDNRCDASALTVRDCAPDPLPGLRQSVNKVSQGMTDLYLTLEGFSRRLDDVERRRPVGFMVALESSGAATVQKYRGGENMAFSHVYTNYGGHYNEARCRFKTPVKGLYHFAVSIRAADPDSEAWVEVISLGQNEEGQEPHVLGRLHLNRFRRHDHGLPNVGMSGSSTYLREIDAGTEVWVRAGKYGDESHEMKFFVGLTEEAYTSFSGHLVG